MIENTLDWGKLWEGETETTTPGCFGGVLWSMLIHFAWGREGIDGMEAWKECMQFPHCARRLVRSDTSEGQMQANLCPNRLP